MRLKLKNIWAFLVFLICLSVTESGKKLVKNLMFLFKVIFNQEIPINWIYLSYKSLLCGFVIVSIIMFLSYCQKKHNQKSNSTKVEPEFEGIIKNPNLRNIWVIGPWGSGKTKFVKSSLDKLGKKYFYISLFGLSTRNDIIQEINEQVTSETKLSLIVELPVIGLFFKWLFQINGLSILRNFSDKWIIVLDDFERVSNGFRENKNSEQNSESIEPMSKMELDSYNDVLGVIDYLQQSFGCKMIVISSKEFKDELFDKIIIPKFHPYQYHIKFSFDLIKDFPKDYFKKDKPKDVEIYSKIFSIVWKERVDLNHITNYRPIIYELSLLSDETDNRYKISYTLSRLIDDWGLEMVSGRLIPFEFLVNSVEKNEQNNSKYTLIKEIVKESKSQSGFPYYISKKRPLKVTKFGKDDAVREALVYSYMRIENAIHSIPNDYKFDKNGIKLLTSQDPTTLLQGREIRDWVVKNYIQHHYFQSGESYKDIPTSNYQAKWENIYQAAVVNYFVKDIGLETNSALAYSIVKTLKKFEFLILDIGNLKEIIDADYVNQILLVENPEGTHVDSRILYRYFSKLEIASNSMSLYLVLNYYNLNDLFLHISKDDLFIPIIDARTSIIEDFIASNQYAFEKLLWDLKENTYNNNFYKDEKEFDRSNLTISREHAYFIVEFMEYNDKINGETIDMYIKEFISKNNTTEKEDLIKFVNNLIESSGNEKNKRTSFQLDPFSEKLKNRYKRWISDIEQM